MTLTVTGLVSLSATQSIAADQGVKKFTPSMSFDLALANGTGANQADLIFSDQRATASEELDLAGSLTDVFGTTITFARIKAIFIKCSANNTVDMYVGGSAANGFVGPFVDATDKIKVRPGGMALLAAPDATAWAVTAGTGDLLKIAASDGSTSSTYDIIIIGASA